MGSNEANKYPKLADYSYFCVAHLMKTNETVWKLLKHNDPDAYRKPDLTQEEKAAMIYTGQEDATLSRVFIDAGQPDVWTQEDCIIRISPYSIFPNTPYWGTVSMLFEVYSHYKINTLSNYRTRIDTIAQQMLEVFNGATIEGIGELFFDRLASLDNRLYMSGQIPYKGKSILLSTRST